MRRLVLLPILLILSCATNDTTGRHQDLLLGRDAELALGARLYEELLAAAPGPAFDRVYVEPVERVVRRLTTIAESGAGRLAPPKFDWEIHVIDDPKIAAVCCLPGGRIVVYTGIFPACQNENGLAIALSHQMLHAILHHGNERVTAELKGNAGLGAHLPPTDEEAARLKSAGELLGLGDAPAFAATLESEADELGLMLAARAGFDPRVAPDVWSRIASASHPGSGALEKWMPDAVAAYAKTTRRVVEDLPAPGRSRRLQPPDPPAVELSTGVRGTPGFLRFTANHAAFVGVIVLESAAAKVTIPIRAGVAAGEPREVLLPGEAVGQCTLTFQGTILGRPWRQTLTLPLP